MGRRTDERQLYATPNVLRVIVHTPKIPAPYKALLLVHAYIDAKFPGGRKALVQARFPDDVEIDQDDGSVRVMGFAIADYAAQHLAHYLRTWRAFQDSEWLFPGARRGNDEDKHCDAIVAARYIGKIKKGTIAL